MDRRILLALFLFIGLVQSQLDWKPAEDILQAGVDSGVFPGCTALVGNKSGIIWQKGFGNYTYGLLPPYPINGQNPPDDVNTLFDLASCTKIVGATQAIAQFYQRGELDLYTKVGDIIGKDFNANGKTDIAVINCLLHNAGFPPDPNPNYYEPGPLECPQTKNYYPQEDFSCSDIIWDRLCQQTLINPIGEVMLYSDLSFITLSYVVGNLARNLGYINASQTIPGCINPNITEEANDRCYFEAYVQKYVLDKLEMKNTGFLPPKSVWEYCAPTDNDTTYRHFLPQGQVSDQNSYSMGGVSGHAGIFSNVYDLHILLNRTLFATPDDSYLNSTTVKLFTTEYNHSQSSRALGWDTNDPTVNDYGWDQSCGRLFSPKTFMHLGYTGTLICADPDREIYSVLLTNRVYLNDTTFSSNGIHTVRTAFGDAVVTILDSIKTPEERAEIEEKRVEFLKKRLSQ